MSFRFREAKKLANPRPPGPSVAGPVSTLPVGSLSVALHSHGPRSSPRPSRSPTLLSPLPGGPRATHGARPSRFGLLQTGRKTRGGVLGGGAGRCAQAQWPPGWAEEAPSSTPDAISLPETGPATALTQETLLRPPLATGPPARVRATSPPDFAPAQRAKFGVPRRTRRSRQVTACESKISGCPNSDVETATEGSVEIPLIMYLQRRPAEAGKAFNLLCCDPSLRPPHIVLPPLEERFYNSVKAEWTGLPATLSVLLNMEQRVVSAT